MTSVISDAETSKPAVKLASLKFSTYEFKKEALEKKLIFRVVKMTDSLLIYVNDENDYKFSDFSLALKCKSDTVGSRLVGSYIEDYSKNLACRLSKRTGKTVFLSCNVEPDRLLMPLIERTIKEEITKYPEKF